MEEQMLLQNVQRVGSLLARLLGELQARRRHVGIVTGRGLMVGHWLLYSQ